MSFSFSRMKFEEGILILLSNIVSNRGKLSIPYCNDSANLNNFCANQYVIDFMVSNNRGSFLLTILDLNCSIRYKLKLQYCTDSLN